MSHVREYKTRLQKKYSYLIETLEIDPVIDLCYQKTVLTFIDLERLRAEHSRPDKVKLFIAILKSKSDVKCYNGFLETLEDEQVQQPFVKKKLDETLVTDQHEEFEQLRLLERIVRDCVAVRDKAELPVEDLLRTVRVHLHRHHQPLQATPPELYDLVTSVFPAVSRKRNKEKNIIALQNCCLNLELSSAVDNADEDVVDAGEALNPVPLETITPDRVSAVMRICLEKQNLSTDLAARFEEEDIDGEVLAELDEGLVEKLFPELTLGKRLKVLKARNEAVEELKKPPGRLGRETSGPVTQKLETYRSFDSRPCPRDVYEKGHVLPEEQSRPGHLLEPLHKYCSSRRGTDTNRLAQEAVQFAAACMNERVNGTIHFGVAGKFEVDTAGKLPAGGILGVRIDKQKCEFAITEEIYRGFPPDQREVAIKCIRDPVFVPVVGKGVSDKDLYVVEVDIIPQSSLVANDAFFLTPVTGKHSHLYRYVNGSVVSVEAHDIYEFMRVKNQLSLQRKETEKASRPKPMEVPNLNRKLHGLLTGEHEFDLVDIYPILFTGPISGDMTNSFLAENFTFIKSLEPLAVFDFDPSMQDANGQARGLYSVMESHLGQVYKALTTDNFDKGSTENSACGSKDGIAKLLESIENSSFKCWIFCNGYMPLGKEEQQATTWRSQRGEGFKEAVRFYKSKIPSEKACIIILLLSKNYDVVLGALEEIFTKFPDQWILVAESEKVAQDLMAEVVRRSYVEKRTLEERSVIGMPWSHVNQSVMNICGCNIGTGCTLPSSTGTPCLMKEREKNELSDLDILSVKECEEQDIVRRGTPEQIEKKKKKFEIDFYRGKTVSWWNFYFSDQVLRRAQFHDLLKEVNKRLDGQIQEDEKVAVISLLHQRGAGGSTTAREILWELRKDVRCCVIKQITDQTCDQIARFRNFEEQACPSPPLVLIDNEDQEKVFQLCSHLNEKAGKEAKDRGFPVFCVLVICVRMADFPRKKDKSKVTLGHALLANEIQWFRTTYERLEEEYNRDQLSLHPKLLISFNILKENFDQGYIKHAVEEFVSKITEFREKQLLKYIALINSFDPDFKSIPMSCFNPIMCPSQAKGKERPRLGQKTFSKGDIHWEARLSQSINVLLNRTSELCLGGDVKSVRIISSYLSREVLKYLCQQDGKKISDVILEFLHSDVFKPYNESSVQSLLVKIMKDMLKKRAEYKKGKAKFSPIILEIGEKEGYDQAAQVLKVGFEKFDDPMIAQQIARIYIHCQNWKLAEKYTKIAQDMKPKSSYMCDTHGQVYKERLIGVLKDRLESEKMLEGEEARDVLDMAFEAIKIFRREQMLSDEDSSPEYNNCGFFSELRVVVTLLDCCRFFPAFKFDQGAKLHKFLVKKADIPHELLEIGDDRIAQLKMLYFVYQKPMRRLEDEQIQLKEDSCYQYSPSYTSSIKDRMMFVHLQECLDTYFGEDSDFVPMDLSEEDACEFRRRRVRRRGGNSLRSIYGLRDEENAKREYAGMHALIEKNVLSNFCNAFDLKTILSLTMARISQDESCARRIPLECVLDWALQLYDKAKLEPLPYLEAYLYLVMLHWPTAWRVEQNLNLCPCNKIKEVIKEWKVAFQNNHPAQREEEGKKVADRRKSTTLFFLGQGGGYREIVFYSELQGFECGHKMVDSIWNTPEAKKRLMKLKGTLLYGGGEMSVTIHSPKGSATPLTIPTSFPIKDASLWQKSVRFVLGFCWSGPKAFSVTRDDETIDLQAASTPINFPEPRKPFDRREQKMMSIVAVHEFWTRFYAIRTERGKLDTDIRLNEKNRMKSEGLQKEKVKLEREREDLVQKRTSVLQGPD
ncbi:sterile alpha motif domain-containing protein 9-like [Littorina saxatilis]|uniref:sterile alpha motif domain-containing protein 9-like n=1 Tax=Littorina saxatilis TaxID=31220 RepID=UPI0038B49EBA